MAMRTEDMCGVCVTAEHCTHHGRCLAECLPSELAAPVGEPAPLTDRLNAMRGKMPDDEIDAYKALLGEPAPMPPEMPEIQVGDWYLAHGHVERPMFPWNVNVENGRIVHSRVALADIEEVRGERNGVPFIWRRTDRKEPTT